MEFLGIFYDTTPSGELV